MVTFAVVLVVVLLLAAALRFGAAARLRRWRSRGPAPTRRRDGGRDAPRD